MKEVVCWCCEYFLAKYEDPIFRELITKGMCTYKLQIIDPEESVCEEFLLYSGLHTKRIIPDRCKNYHYKRRIEIQISMRLIFCNMYNKL